ncbi:hypothetical protein B0H11DRAFT_1914615 [Mycena galericulata]|nr:hypothetical protein B0H11DRAFT_1914615 [Mycena galericulata]
MPQLAEHPAFARLVQALARKNTPPAQRQPSNTPPDIDMAYNDIFSGPLSRASTPSQGSTPGGSFRSPSPPARGPLGKRKRVQEDDEDDFEEEEEEEEEFVSMRRPTTRSQTRGREPKVCPNFAGPILRGADRFEIKIGKSRRPCDQKRGAGATSKRRKQDRLERGNASRLRGGAGSETPPVERQPCDLRTTPHSPCASTSGSISTSTNATYLEKVEKELKRTPKKNKKEYDMDGTPPKTSSQGGQLLSKMAAITSNEGQAKLDDLIEELMRADQLQTQEDANIHSLPSLVDIGIKGASLLKKGKLLDLHILLMYARFRLAMHNDRTKQIELATKMNTSDRTIRNWKDRGQRVLNLAAGGTFYILLIVAALDLKELVIGNHSYLSHDIESVANTLRNPRVEDSWSNVVTTTLIPQIQRLYHDPRLKKILCYGTKDITDIDLKAADLNLRNIKIDFKNIDWNDQVLDQLHTNGLLLRQRSPRWDRILIKPTGEKPYQPNYSIEQIQTSMKIPKGKSPVPADPNTAKKWVEIERHRAEHGKTVVSVEELRKELNRDQNRDSYIRFNTNILEGSALCIKGVAADTEIDDDIVLVLTDMPQALGETIRALPHLLNAALGDGLIHQDSRSDNFAGEAIHLEPAYNRYSEKGTDTPCDNVHPHFIRRKGAKQVNHGQRVPRASREIVQDQDAYSSLVAGLTGVCEYLADRLYHHRPELTNKLEAYIDILPRNEACPWAPFGGIVVNLNACSDAHLDGLDLHKRCVVIPLMEDCQGGGLVLHEARLVLDLHTGHVVLFPSGRYTHFNLHYQGVRASLVFHTDAASKQWTQGEGGKPGLNNWIGENSIRVDPGLVHS